MTRSSASESLPLRRADVDDRNNLYRAYDSDSPSLSNSYACMSTLAHGCRASSSANWKKKGTHISCVHLNLLRRGHLHRRDCFASAETAGEIGSRRISKAFVAACSSNAPKP